MFKYHEYKGYIGSTKAIAWTKIEPKKYQVQVHDFDSALEWIKENDWWVWDCDGGREDTYFVGLTDGKEYRYYKIDHDFWANHSWDDDGEHSFEVINTFEVKEITKDEAKVPDDRDWMNISEFNYKLKKWPLENE